MRSGDFTRFCASAGIAALLTFTAASACDIQSPAMREHMQHRPQHQPMAPASHTPCVDGMAGIYPCSNIDLLAFVPVAQFQATTTNSLWGWTDPDSGIEYALIGANNGIAFYDLSTPDQPRYLGKLPTSAGQLDLARRARLPEPRVRRQRRESRPRHAGVRPDTPSRGDLAADVHRGRPLLGIRLEPHDLDQRDDRLSRRSPAPTSPVPAIRITAACRSSTSTIRRRRQFAGCINDAGYTHESQCYVYSGPDTEHAGRDLCFDSNGSSGRIAIVDVTDKTNPAHAVVDAVQRQRVHAPELAHRRSALPPARRRARRRRHRQQRAHIHLRRQRSRRARAGRLSRASAHRHRPQPLRARQLRLPVGLRSRRAHPAHRRSRADRDDRGRVLRHVSREQQRRRSTAPGTTTASPAAATSSRPASTKASSCCSRTCAKRR